MASERPKYRRTHRKNIIKEATISKNKLEPGHIVRFNYGGKKVTTKRPLVLVLNPSYKGGPSFFKSRINPPIKE